MTVLPLPYHHHSLIVLKLKIDQLYRYHIIWYMHWYKQVFNEVFPNVFFQNLSYMFSVFQSYHFGLISGLNEIFETQISMNFPLKQVSIQNLMLNSILYFNIWCSPYSFRDNRFWCKIFTNSFLFLVIFDALNAYHQKKNIARNLL